MNNEIKEILDKLSNRKQETLIQGLRECQLKDIEHPFITKEEYIDKILDYIINLRTIEQQYSALLSENAELQNKYNKALELLSENCLPCEQDDFNVKFSDYCELNCSNDNEQFKKCWDKFIEWKLKEEKNEQK